MTYDRATGRVTEQRIPVGQGPLQRYTKAGIGIGQLLETPEAVAKNFAAWNEVDDPSVGDYPKRVKVFSLFHDILGEEVRLVGSGTLIDAEHVLTAAHCVFPHQSDEHIIPSYAEEIEVVPGYEGNARPFGTARMVQIHTWTPWIEDHDYDHDIAVIDLDRPIGIWTGWWGYGYDEDCGDWEGEIWRHAGWPAETPFTGQLMYENGGTFDDCYTYRVSWDGPSWGGLSGSGALRETGAVYGVLSTSDRSSITVDCQLTSTKFTHIETFILEDIPISLDLALLAADGPDEANAGERLAWLTFLVGNYSWVTASGPRNYSTWLSTDDSLSADDVHLTPDTFSQTIPAIGGSWIEAPLPPMIPAETTEGWYYLIVALDDSDWNNANNVAQGWQGHSGAIRLEVHCPYPASPALIYPNDGQTCLASDVLLQWQASFPLAEYDVQIGTAPEEGPIVQTTLTTHSCFGLALDTTYYWRVRTRAQCSGAGGWSASRSFHTVPDPAVVSSLVSPEEGSNCESTTQVTLAWTPLSGAATYDVEYGTACYTGTLLAGIAGTSQSLSHLQANTTYYWRVRAHTVCGQTTAWSSAAGSCWSFKTAPTSIAAPILRGPVDGTTCGTPGTTLWWDPVDGCDQYVVVVGPACGAGTSYVTATTVLAPPDLASGVVYWWTVRAYHPCGLRSPVSACWSFSLDLEPPTNPTSLFSTSHTAGTWETADNTVDVQWNYGWDECTGVWPEYATLWDHAADTAPTEVTAAGEIIFETSPPLPDGKDHWFHLRAVDYAGNLATETMHLGPFWIDLSPPSLPWLDYATLDEGQTIGPTHFFIEWLPSVDPVSGVVGYSYLLGGTPTPPPDTAVETTGLFYATSLIQSGQYYFRVRGVNGAGVGGGTLVYGPITIDPDLFGIWFTAPAAGEILLGGQVHRVNWELYDGGPPVLAAGRLEYSLNGGTSYQAIDGDLSPADITQRWYDWTAPAVSSEQAVLRLLVRDTRGYIVTTRSRRFTLLDPTGVPERPDVDGLVLEAARPNPFNPRTTIGFSLPEDSPVRLAVYDLGGKLVRTLLGGITLASGWHEVEWDGRDDRGLVAAAGVYLYRLQAGQHSLSRRMVLVK